MEAGLRQTQARSTEGLHTLAEEEPGGGRMSVRGISTQSCKGCADILKTRHQEPCKGCSRAYPDDFKERA